MLQIIFMNIISFLYSSFLYNFLYSFFLYSFFLYSYFLWRFQGEWNVKYDQYWRINCVTIPHQLQSHLLVVNHVKSSILLRNSGENPCGEVRRSTNGRRESERYLPLVMPQSCAYISQAWRHWFNLPYREAENLYKNPNSTIVCVTIG